MFLRSQTGLLRAGTKTLHPYEWGILGVNAIALGWLSDERFPRDHRHQPAALLANKIAGARSRLAFATNAKLHQLKWVVP
jgi:hypothetical protein